MIAALIFGVLFRPAEKRVAKSGKPYVVATVKVKGDEGSHFIRITVFSESLQAELMRLSDGDALAAQGRLTVENYVAADGTAKISLSIVAEQILPLRSPPMKRSSKAKPSPSAQEKERAFDDAIPF